MAGIVNKRMLPKKAGGEAETDEGYERLVASALRVARQPGMIAQIKEAAQEEAPAQKMAAIAYGIVTAVGEASGGIEEDYAPQLAAEVLGYVADAVEKLGGNISGQDVAAAMYMMVEMYALDSGASPQDIDAIRSQLDFGALAQAAESELSGTGEEEDAA